MINLVRENLPKPGWKTGVPAERSATVSERFPLSIKGLGAFALGDADLVRLVEQMPVRDLVGDHLRQRQGVAG